MFVVGLISNFPEYLKDFFGDEAKNASVIVFIFLLVLVLAKTNFEEISS
jgi:hypothetical protein